MVAVNGGEGVVTDVPLSGASEFYYLKSHVGVFRSSSYIVMFFSAYATACAAVLPHATSIPPFLGGKSHNELLYFTLLVNIITDIRISHYFK